MPVPRPHRPAPRHNPRPRLTPLLATLLLLATTLLACSDTTGPASGRGLDPIFGGTPVPTPTRFVPATPPPATPAPPGTAAPGTAAPDTGTVTVGGASYPFTVRTCTVVNGDYFLVGDGGASVALASLLLVQLPGRASYTVEDPEVAASGATLTASGTGINLTSPRERVQVALTATCPALAH